MAKGDGDANLSRNLRRFSRSNDCDRDQLVREMLCLDDDSEEKQDPFDVDGDDEDRDPNYVPEAELAEANCDCKCKCGCVCLYESNVCVIYFS